MQILIFFGILSLVVLIHELGHLLAAKMFGIRVDEFGFGLPPKVVTLFRKGGTDYTINALPIGGFVKLYGEEGKTGIDIDDNRAFWSKPVWQRCVVVVAGVVMNFVLAVVLFATVYSFMGIPTKINGVKISEIRPGSPIAQLEVKEGEVINEVRVGGMIYEIKGNDDFLKLVAENKGNEIEMVLESGSSFRVTPRVNPPAGEGSLGVVISDSELRQYPWWQMPFRGAVVGLEEAFMWGRDILAGFGEMIYKIVTGKGIEKESLAGPIGIYQITGKVSKSGILPLLQFVGILSVNLAILNIMPFPALDGGRLVFLILEQLIGKRIKDTAESVVHSVGMIILLSLMVLITLNDLLRVLGGWNGVMEKLRL